MARRDQDFQAIRSEGGLLPLDLLLRVRDPQSQLPGTTPDDYGLPAGERRNEVITQSWNRLRKHWVEFRDSAEDLAAGVAGTGLTNDKWSLPLLRELGFGLLPVTAGPELAGRPYPIGRFFGPAPIHLVGCGLSLDRRAAGQRGAASANPHGLVQEFLNRSDGHLWAIVSNGLRLRVLRDSQALSRQSFLEFDLEAMFSGEVYSDFVLLWLIAHATRFTAREGDRPETCRLEQWTQEAKRLGTRALGDLRGGVERALGILGAGFTGHPGNEQLREALRSGSLTPAALHEQLLRVVYRLIFLFVAEDRTLDGRSLLHPPDDSDSARTARQRYGAHYGTARLRRLAGRIKGSRHGDLWRQFRFLVAPLSGDPQFADARRHLALPSLGSFLWDPASTADLNDLDLANYDFLETLRHLAYIRQGQMLRPVDYHNLGAEELGGVYESLLSLTPQVSGGGAQFTFAEFSGNRRKTTGSYYTPDALVQCLLDSALDPVVEEATRGKTGPEAQQAILDLKVCDPAVGSGHFLVGAAHRLARHLARTRAHSEGESEPSPLLYQQALRDVIGRCLYGVDLNPMSAELCRVGLWLEALEPGKPLTFLDHHIRVGNSLLGATQELIDGGIPDKAFKAIQGDEPKTCSALRKRNKKERESRQREMVLRVAEPRVEYDSLAARSRSLDGAPDGTLDDVHRKEEQFRGLVESSQYRDQRQVADAWCAAFVWPKRLDTPAEPITTETIRRLEDGRHSMSSPEEEELERLADRFQFFHWHLEFPGVFENAGFDCVIGNPPWEHIELKEIEWFSERHEGIVNARTGAERKRLIAALKDVDQPLYRAYQEALRSHDGLSHLLRDGGRYPQCGRGRINLYAVFAEAIRSLLNEHGRAGCVLPTGIATDDTTKVFFQDVVENRSLVSLYDFENKGVFFPGVHRNYKFSLFAAGSGASPTADRAEFVFFAHSIGELLDPGRRFTLSPEEIALLNPNTRTCPIFRSQADAELTKAIYRRVPVLVREARVGQPEQNPWGIRFKQGLFNMTTDSSLFRVREELEGDGWQLDGNVFRRQGEEHFPLYEAKMIHHFDHRWASYGEARGKLAAVDVPLMDKQNPDLTALPRYWVEARDVYLRSADLPTNLVDALSKRSTPFILISLAHLLFAQWLRQRFGHSAEAARQALFPSWIAFVEHHPFARDLAPIEMGLCEDGPAAMKPQDLSWLPAVPLDEIQMSGDSNTPWYPVSYRTAAAYLSYASEFAHVNDLLADARLSDETDALDFAEHLLVRASPRWLMGWRDVTRSVEKRTTIASVVPCAAVGHKFQLIFSSTSPRQAAALLACINSVVFDFLVRQKISGASLSFYTMKQIGGIPPSGYSDADLEFIVPRVLELLYTGWDLEPFAHECGYRTPPFVWDDERRFLLRCELDAAFFHLYMPADREGDWRPVRETDGCAYDENAKQLADLTRHFPRPRDAVSYILDTFPGVCGSDQKMYGEYRTKRVLLDIYDAMQEAASTGVPYQTLLDPPPADPRCCHPPRAISIDRAALADGEWARPPGEEEEAESAVLAAVLKATGGPQPRRTVRLAALLAMEPSLLLPSLTPEDASHWQRLIGPEASPQGLGITQLQPPSSHAWGTAVSHLRGTGRLIEDLAAGTWAPGPALEAIHTEGWPEGRVGMVMEALRRRDTEEIAQTLPAPIRDWIDAEAA